MTTTAEVLRGFEVPELGHDRWTRLLRAGDTDEVFLTAAWQQAWWESFGRGDLLIVLARRNSEPVAIAPMFLDQGMIFLVGSGGSDYLDLVGDASDPEVLDAILQAAMRAAREFVGFRFYHVPDASGTGTRLQASAGRLGLVAFDEGHHDAPALDLELDAKSGRPAEQRVSLVRHERRLRRDGELTVEHLRDAVSIAPHLEGFFSQHRARRAVTPDPSLFCQPEQCAFYRRVVEVGAAAGWLRFTRLLLDDRPAAYHFGFSYGGRFLWYKPSFEVELASRSPGEVLLRQLFIAARHEAAHTFDFGLGDEKFKTRFATHHRTVRTWGVYHPDALG